MENTSPNKEWYSEIIPNAEAAKAAEFWNKFGVEPEGWDIICATGDSSDENLSEPPLGAPIYGVDGRVWAYGVGRTGEVMKPRTAPETEERRTRRIEATIKERERWWVAIYKNNLAADVRIMVFATADEAAAKPKTLPSSEWELEEMEPLYSGWTTTFEE